ncbi:MAG: hypothetical protein Unbinned1819contig1001_27 [Prokaryotic dsDNA virus sp.]|nr:MAG: hypothetical protein Unbinned1819contig1001_27 [Prokaryotic dsDNA virus sp.]|tara:strand:+ start:17064 stop:17342 length:279 start_codon:yes stop_codon:yes gene_type:complete
MQKLFNVIAVAGFVLSAGLTAATVAAYWFIPKITQEYIEGVKGDILPEVKQMMPKVIDEKLHEIDETIKNLPSLPQVTGPAIPLQKTRELKQ